MNFPERSSLDKPRRPARPGDDPLSPHGAPTVRRPLATPPRPRAGEDADAGPSEELLDYLFERCFTDLQAVLEQGGPSRRLHGREATVAEALGILAAPLVRHPVLTGRPGVGKTVVAYAIADRIRRGDCPEALRGLRLWATSPSRIVKSLPSHPRWRDLLN